jgi:large subunit ribosomal protein L10
MAARPQAGIILKPDGPVSIVVEAVMDRTEKTESIESLKGLFDEAGVVVITHYSGLTVAEMTTLRVRLAEAGAGLKVVKNRLAKIALDGRPGAAASDLFKGPIAIAFSPDPVSAPKVLVEFAKSNEKLKLLGAIMGDSIIDQAGVKALATLPSLDELRGKIVGLLQAPATRVATVLQAPAGQLARVFKAYADKADAA